jgi:FAD/FMN-containing dehydrogenase
MAGQSYPSFGLATATGRRAVAPAEAIALLKSGDTGAASLLPYGNGRSYGDTCQNGEGTLVDMRAMNRLIQFNPDTGLFRAEAGMLLSEIIALGAPHGLFPPVVPGTQFVTLGGAIANDVHGKNHHRRGTFGCHVEALTLLRSDGRELACSPTSNPRLFWATIGGMGLTGLILAATIRLMRVPSLDILQQIRPFSGIAGYFDLAEAADAENEYVVAWIDQLAGGRDAGRGVLITGNHVNFGSREAIAPGRRLSVPFQPPVTLLNRPFLRVFNTAYGWSKRRQTSAREVGYQGFFFPLDGVRNWNRLYGPRGLYQHQSVVPAEAAREVVPAMLAAAREAGQGSFLTVLKRFGDVRSPGLFSFPRPGHTLTLDFPNRGEATLALLRRLDEMTITAGGAVNPYKDARMGADVFAASFPDWQRLECLRDPAFMSDFWARTAGTLAPHRPGALPAAAE